jgi:superfamily I DNA/RNA helicase
VSNIVTFRDRYPDVATFELTTNRRSRPQIIAVANDFSLTIPDRIEKEMRPHRPAATGTAPAVVAWSATTELDEAGWVASLVLELAERGLPYKDIAVLVRSRAAYPRLVEQFATFGIPVQPGGRSGLFDQPDAVLLGKTFAWLADFHVMRAVTEATRATGRTPSPAQVEAILDSAFFLPTANKPAHRQLRDAARRLVATYIEQHEDDLHRVWETERPFELHLDGVIVAGRADVILVQEGGVPTALAIMDYKTSTTGDAADNDLQLQV